MINPISQHAEGHAEQFTGATMAQPAEVTMVNSTGESIAQSTLDTHVLSSDEATAKSDDNPTVEPSEGVTAEPTDESEHQSAGHIEDHDGQFIGNYIDQLKARLAQHLAAEPAKPRKFKVLYDNTTPEAMFRGMVENGASVALVSDEAGKIFNGRGMNDLAMMNSARDGSTLQVERVVAGSAIVREPRFSFLGMIQPGPFEKYFERRGDEAREIGFFARCFVCFPSSTQGTRYIRHVPPSWQHLPKFHERVTEILEENLLHMEDPEFTRPALEFSPDAKQLWIDAFNKLEPHLYPGQYFADINDYGSKFAENLARMAALLHFFCGETGDISYETTNRALAICNWFLNEFKRLFSAPPEIPQEISDAGLIEVWIAGLLRANCCLWTNGIPYLKKNDILKSGPNPVRNKFSLNAALNYMALNNRARVVKFGKTNFVELNYQYFTNLSNYLQSQGGVNYLGQPPMLPPGR